MATTMPDTRLAREGNGVADRCQAHGSVETAGKSLAIRFLNDAIDESGVQRKTLAVECGWSEGQFSKVASGQQGDALDLVYRLPAHRAALRADFFARLMRSEQADPLSDATEQLAVAAIRWFRAARQTSALPARAAGPIKASLRRRSDKEIAV